MSNLKNQFKINNVNKITNFSKSKSNYPDKKNRKKIIRGFIDAILDKKNFTNSKISNRSYENLFCS